MSILVKHFVKKSLAIEKLNSSTLSQVEKEKLTSVLVLIYHQKLLNRLLDYLEEEDKQNFLQLLAAEKSLETVEFLHQKIERLEDIVEVALIEIEQELLIELAELER